MTAPDNFNSTPPMSGEKSVGCASQSELKILTHVQAVVVPIVSSLSAVWMSAQQSPWFLCSLPIIWVSSRCTSPNLNLADGFVAYLFTVLGFGLTFFFKPLGLAILFGALFAFYGSAFEKRLRARIETVPADEHLE